MFKLKLKEYPRTWTKDEWKEVHSYTRYLRRQIEKRAEVHEINKSVFGMLMAGDPWNVEKLKREGWNNGGA